MCTTISNIDIGGGESPSASCLITKKTASKKQRVPKRGPGVAELEKILREQGDHKPEELLDRHKNANTTSDVAVVPSPPAATSLPSSPPPSSSASKTLAFAPLSNPTHNSPPGTQLYSFLPQPTMRNPGESSHDVGNCSKSAFRFPFSTLLGSNGSDQQAIPSPVFFQRSQQQSCPTMMNLFPHNSSAADQSTIEPPSNQTVLHRQFPVSWPDEDTPSMVGTKRSFPYTMDIPQIPAFRYQVPSFLPQVTESVSTYSPGSHYRANPELTNANYRGQSSYYPNYEQSLRRWSANSDSKDPAAAEEQGSFVLLGCPTTTRVPKQQHFNFNPPLPCQEMKKAMDCPVNKLPFYSFIVPEEGGQQEINGAETELSFMSEREMTRGDGLDLSLKL